MTREQAIAKAQAALEKSADVAAYSVADADFARSRAFVDVADGWMRLAETIVQTNARTRSPS